MAWAGPLGFFGVAEAGVSGLLSSALLEFYCALGLFLIHVFGHGVALLV